jgi:hypothetical protein
MDLGELYLLLLKSKVSAIIGNGPLEDRAYTEKTLKFNPSTQYSCAERGEFDLLQVGLPPLLNFGLV